MNPLEERGERIDHRGRYEDRAEAGRAIEAQYRIPEGFKSVLGYVDSERDDLIPAFWAWRAVGKRDGRLGDLARQWERERFGAELYTSAHQVLMFAIMQSLAPGERPSRYGRIQSGLTTQERKEKLDEALEAITRERSLPEKSEVPI